MNRSVGNQQYLEWGGVILALILLTAGQATLAAAILLLIILLFGYRLTRSAASAPTQALITPLPVQTPVAPTAPLSSAVSQGDQTLLNADEPQSDVVRIEKLLEFRDQVMHMAVHDLRGPLTAILNGIDLTLLTEAPLDENEKQRILRLCRDSGNSLMRQIDSLLDITQIENNNLPLKPEPQKVNDLVDSAYNTLANTFIEMRVKLEQTFSDELPEIMADREIMRRVFVNLLDNALRFTMRGTEVRVHASLNGDAHPEILISISDNGPGIPESQRNIVFEPYRRLAEHGRKSGGRRGVGLGLTFCKLAIEAHGGSISVEDANEGMSGARFVVRLPLNS